jgi:hypothetical protein
VDERIEILTSYDEAAVSDVLHALERRGSVELVGTEAAIADSLISAGYARAIVNVRFVLDDGTLRLRVQSDGLTVAGTWLKSRFESPAGKR